MIEKPTLTIDVVSDVVCPWCFLGMRNLQHALADLADVEVTVRWRPFQLDPTIPPEGLDRQSYLLQKFGDPDRIEAAHDRLREMGAAVGITYDFAAIQVAPNTLDAHRVIRWAATSGEEVQNRLVGRLFALYFEEGRNIGDHAVLVDAARDAGMDAAVVTTLLPTTADLDEVKEEIDTLREVLAFVFEASLMTGQMSQTAITRKLASWAAILAVPTAIAGMYGMNFKNMPELEWQYGYPLALLLMVIAAVLPYYFFKWKKWL
jgi:predicted DsbA family dithiol-disulfide isomerase